MLGDQKRKTTGMPVNFTQRQLSYLANILVLVMETVLITSAI